MNNFFRKKECHLEIKHWKNEMDIWKQTHIQYVTQSAIYKLYGVAFSLGLYLDR